jgi:hypothetical protein
MQTRGAGSWIYSFHRALSFSLALFSVCRAVLVNRTIDSTYGDPLTGFVPQYYAPSDAWADQTCTGCYIQPNPLLAFDGTWMAATYHPEYQNINFTLQFTGTAIYVFFILSNANSHGNGTTTNTQCNFTLDGQPVGTFSHNPDMSTFDLEYNVTVFSQTGLTNTSHQLLVLVNDYPNSTFINFDWAIYTVNLTESPSTNTSSSSTSTQSLSSTSLGSSATHNAASPRSLNTGIIVGCVLGVVAVAVIAIALFYIRRLRRSRQLHEGMTPGGIDIFQRESPRVESHYRNPSYSNISTSTSGALTGLRPNRGRGGEGPPIREVQIDERLRSVPNQASRGEVRAKRQMEISERFRSAQQELDQLIGAQSTQPASDSSSAPARSQQEMASLRDQVQELRNRIQELQDQRQSDSALGLPDEQPPAYY